MQVMKPRPRFMFKRANTSIFERMTVLEHTFYNRSFQCFKYKCSNFNYNFNIFSEIFKRKFYSFCLKGTQNNLSCFVNVLVEKVKHLRIKCTLSSSI
jgi:hypothetical protein